MSPVVKELSMYEKTNVTLLDEEAHPLRRPLKSIKSLIKRANKENVVPWEFYLDWKILKKSHNEYTSIKKIIKTSLKTILTEKNSSYNNVNFKNYLIDWIINYVDRNFLFIISKTKTANKILKKEGFNAVVLLNEYGGMGLSIAIAAKNLGIPIISLQHGFILKSHSGYNRIIKKVDEVKDINYPISDKLLLYGNFFKKVLTELEYSNDKLVVIGDPKLDILINRLKTTKKTEIIKKLDLNPNKKTILYATQPLNEERKKFVVDLISEAMKKLPDVQLIILNHPVETQLQTYTSLIEKLGSNRIKFAKNGITYDLLISCDILLTSFSSIVIEAMVCGKPIISINFPNEVHYISLLTQGKTIQVNDSSSLYDSIRKILFDSKSSNELIEIQNKVLKVCDFV